MDSDFDEELLALADGASSRPKNAQKSKKKKAPGEKKRKRAAKDSSGSDMDVSDDDSDFEVPQSKRSKRRNASAEEDRDDDDGDNGEDDEEEEANPYPLEGLYKDEADRQRLLQMSEIEREGILGERQEELQSLKDRRALNAMLKEHQKGDVTGVAKSKSTREKKATGATKEKARGLEVLKQRRQAKSEREAKAADTNRDADVSPARPGRSPSPTRSAAYSSSEEGEVGAFSGIEYEREKRTTEYATSEDVRSIVVPRGRLADFWIKPWFDEYVTGTWVRVVIGHDKEKGPVYRLCEVNGVSQEKAKTPYKLEKHLTDVMLDLSHGKAKKAFTMELISNQTFTASEWVRLQATLTNEKLRLPTKKDVGKKQKVLDRYKNEVLTDTDLTEILKKKSEFGGRIETGNDFVTLLSQRDMAVRNNDAEAMAKVESQIARLKAPPAAAPSSSDVLARLNERNRKANREEIRRAEFVAIEERRKAAAAAAAVAASPLPQGGASARRKMNASLLHGPQPNAEVSNPVPTNGTSTPNKGPVVEAAKAKGPATRFEELVASKVSVDLGDF